MNKQAAHHALMRLHHRPLALAAQHTDDMLASLRSLAEMGDMSAEQLEKHHEKLKADTLTAYGYDYSPSRPYKPFAFADGVAIIPIHGVLINRFGSSWGFITGYNFIAAQVTAATQDEDVELIVFDVDSPGGEVVGMNETSDLIYQSRDKKPSLAVVDAQCYSAAYDVASAATRMVITPSGGAGSIGTLTSHVNREKQLADNGLQITYIFSGDHKVDGNPTQALPENVRKDIQASVDQARQKFAETVARNRSLTAEAVLDTEARCYRAEDAVRLGLIDAIQPPREAVSSYYSELTGSDTPEETDDMSANTTKPGQPTPAATTEAAAPADNTLAIAAAIKADRERQQAIFDLPEAAERQKLARQLALTTDLSVEQVKGMLEVAGVETKATAAAATTETTEATPGAGKTSAFSVAMGASGTPGIAADGAGKGGENAASDPMDIIATLDSTGALV